MLMNETDVLGFQPYVRHHNLPDQVLNTVPLQENLDSRLGPANATSTDGSGLSHLSDRYLPYLHTVRAIERLVGPERKRNLLSFFQHLLYHCRYTDRHGLSHIPTAPSGHLGHEGGAKKSEADALHPVLLRLLVGHFCSPPNPTAPSLINANTQTSICIVSIIRLTELTATRRDTDWTYYSITIDFWTLVEANTGIVCACVMTMKPLLSRLILGASATRHKSDSNPDQLGPSIDLFHPPTIGSKPSRRNTQLNKKQSWFTSQLARLDRSLQTVNEAESDAANNSGVLEVGGEGGGGVGMKSPRRRPSVTAFLTVPMRAHLSIPRLSHHSSIIESHMEHEADEGPLEPARYARRSSCAV